MKKAPGAGGAGCLGVGQTRRGHRLRGTCLINQKTGDAFHGSLWKIFDLRSSFFVLNVLDRFAMRYMAWRSSKDKCTHVICMEGEFDDLPSPVTQMGPWLGSSKCVRKGVTLQHPSWAGMHVGFATFPVTEPRGSLKVELTTRRDLPRSTPSTSARLNHVWRIVPGVVAFTGGSLYFIAQDGSPGRLLRACAMRSG